MSNESQNISPLFHIDVQADNSLADPPLEGDVGHAIVDLLRQILDAQDKQNELLEEMNQQNSAAQRQRSTELGQWKQANPELAQGCRQAAETLSRVQMEFLQHLTEEISDSSETLVGSDFMFNEFVDRYGPRLAHLNGVLQVLSQLSSVPNPTNTNS